MTQFIDLDAVAQVKPSLVVKIGGVEHALKPITLDDFLANVSEMKSLELEASEEKQIQVMRGMLLRAFPTMTDDVLGRLTLNQLDQLVTLANKTSGQDDVAQAAEQDAQANPPTAG